MPESRRETNCQNTAPTYQLVYSFELRTCEAQKHHLSKNDLFFVLISYYNEQLLAPTRYDA